MVVAAGVAWLATVTADNSKATVQKRSNQRWHCLQKSGNIGNRPDDHRGVNTEKEGSKWSTGMFWGQNPEYWKTRVVKWATIWSRLLRTSRQ